MNGYRVGVALHPTRDVSDSLDVLVRWCTERGSEVVARAGSAHQGHAGVRVVEDVVFAATVDGVVSLGGDGTLLGAMRGLVGRPVPVLGVDRGDVGFLVEVQPDQLPAALERLVRGDFAVESHPCLRVRVVPGGGGDVPGPADAAVAVGFNDVALARRGGGTPVGATLRVDGDEYGYYRCDALVVATPVGSTAYNYAAGGPVLSPSTPSVVVTPVAPMAGLGRAVVLGDGDEIDLALQRPSSGVAVEVDGTVVANVGQDDAVQVRVQRGAGRVVRLDALRHARASMVKLSLLGVPVRREHLEGELPSAVARGMVPAAGGQSLRVADGSGVRAPRG